jgi:hypothetical protein
LALCLMFLSFHGYTLRETTLISPSGKLLRTLPHNIMGPT